MSPKHNVFEEELLAAAPPTFEPVIPAVLLKDMDEISFRRWLATTLSGIEQRQIWLIQRTCMVGQYTVENHRQINTWKRRIESPVTAIIGLFVWTAPFWVGKALAAIFSFKGTP